jgi:hypothetical protein
MVALLSVLSSLDTLYLGFESPQSRPDCESRSVPPPKRSILPALRRLDFRGVTEYLEELVTRIDTPQLDYMDITFFHQIDFDMPTTRPIHQSYTNTQEHAIKHMCNSMIGDWRRTSSPFRTDS